MDTAHGTMALYFAYFAMELLPYLILGGLLAVFGIGFACGRASK